VAVAVNSFTVVEIRFTSEAFVINQNFSNCVNERMIFISCIRKQSYFCASIIEHYVVPFCKKGPTFYSVLNVLSLSCKTGAICSFACLCFKRGRYQPLWVCSFERQNDSIY